MCSTPQSFFSTATVEQNGQAVQDTNDGIISISFDNKDFDKSCENHSKYQRISMLHRICPNGKKKCQQVLVGIFYFSRARH
jgi:hypothetical protein